MKRTGFKPRTSPLRATAPAKAEVPTSRCKAKGCRVRFVKLSMNHRACSVECARIVVAQDKEDKARQETRLHRAKLADSKPLSHWLKLTEAVVNAYVRQRDEGQPCISCGTWETAAWQAGHCLSVGAHPELRFDLDNIHRQCLRCNVHLSGNQAEYIRRLPEKIGVERVNRLLGPHPAAHYTREGLAQLRAEVRRMAKELER